MKAAQIKAKIISNQRLSGNYWHLEFESGRIAKYAVAGQFVNIRVTDGPAPLLRRPISIHRVKGAKIKLFYEVIGAGTRVLSKRNPGEFLDIIGPLGNGFDYRGSAKAKEGKNVLIAGGMGVAPLVFLAQRLLRPSGARNDTIVLIGAKTKEQILCAQEFKTLGCGVKL
ncbi:MAG: hypothetical protein Q8O41_02000, partial [Candidatus Methanoperedens sp.]|nr:hypothetical protein [Candidatus Methanoperedens sp.]